LKSGHEFGLKKGFLANLDTYESILYTSRAANNSDDYDLQRMMGIRVKMVNQATDHVVSCANALEDPGFSTVRAMRLFGILVRYRLVDIIALLSGDYSSAVPVGRSAGPNKPIPVRSFCELLRVCFDFCVVLQRNG